LSPVASWTASANAETAARSFSFAGVTRNASRWPSVSTARPVYRAVAGRHPPPDVVIARVSAVASTEDAGAQNQRDRHVQLFAERGRIACQRATGHGRRSHVETAVGRYKGLIGPKLRACGLPAQHGEAAIAVEMLNRMLRVAKPISVRAA
jgi:hypothetical protein